jgi:hypothetical protein
MPCLPQRYNATTLAISITITIVAQHEALTLQLRRIWGGWGGVSGAATRSVRRELS